LPDCSGHLYRVSHSRSFGASGPNPFAPGLSFAALSIQYSAVYPPASEAQTSLAFELIRSVVIGDRFVGGAVLHTGPRAFRLSDDIAAVPIATLWS
jgi:hypothetical protein